MGRGRQRAKQAKVARELKYFSPDTDYAALQRELGGSDGSPPAAGVDDSDIKPDDTEPEDPEPDDMDDDYSWTAERR